MSSPPRPPSEPPRRIVDPSALRAPPRAEDGLDAPTAAKLHRAVAKHNVYAAKKKAKFNRHVSNSSKRGALRSQLRALPDVDGKLRTVRKKLGYA